MIFRTLTRLIKYCIITDLRSETNYLEYLTRLEQMFISASAPLYFFELLWCFYVKQEVGQSFLQLFLLYYIVNVQ